MRGASQWNTLGREFVEDLMDQERHYKKFRRYPKKHKHTQFAQIKHFLKKNFRYTFSIQTTIIPDEVLIPTFSLNSAHLNRTVHASLFHLKRFSGKNPYNLCRHSSQADFCGQGPGLMEAQDLPQLSEQAATYFFARKFGTNDTRSPVRLDTIRLSQGK